MKKKTRLGLRMCYLCKSDGENTTHMFLSCPFSKQFYIEVGS